MSHNKADEDCDYVFKVVIVGNARVGKSNLFSRFTTNDFGLQIQPTTTEIATRTIRVDDKFVKAEIWDITLMESEHYRGAVGALVVYDVTRHVTFEDVEWWLKEVRNHTDTDIVIMLVGNKADWHHLRAVSTEDALKFAEKENVLFMETSALEGLNVEDAFTEVLTQIYRGLSVKALEALKDPRSLLKRRTINAGNKDDVSAVKKDEETENLLSAEKEKRKELEAEVEKLQKIMDVLQAEKEGSTKLQEEITDESSQYQPVSKQISTPQYVFYDCEDE